MVDGKPVYIRDGQLYEHGLLGGGLQQAVVGNAPAMVAANEYHDHMRDGLLEMLLGTGAMMGGTVWFAVEAASSADQNHPKIDPIPLVVTAVGFAVMCYGAYDLASAEPYRWDAINLFNDGAMNLNGLQVVDHANLAAGAGKSHSRVLAPPGLEGLAHLRVPEVVAK